VLLVAARPPLPDEDRSILEAIAAEASTLAPAPLSEAAIATLAAARLGPGVDPALVTTVRDATDGNALRVEEMLAEVREGGGADAALPGVERIARRVARRLAALSDAAAPLAAAVAVLGDGAELEVAVRLADVQERPARGAAAELIAADLFADDRVLRFRHPLIRAAVAERVPAIEHGRAHARAARLLAERGKPPGWSRRTPCWRRRPAIGGSPTPCGRRPRRRAARARRTLPPAICAARSKHDEGPPHARVPRLRRGRQRRPGVPAHRQDVREHADALAADRRRPGDRALGQPRRPRHRAAARIGPPTPLYLARSLFAKRRAMRLAAA
jgi:hypothetical protein